MFCRFQKVSNLLMGSPQLLGSSHILAKAPLCAGLRTSQKNSKLQTQKEFVSDEIAEDNEFRDAVISKVNNQIQRKSFGRLFAVVWLMGKQYKITDDDLLVIEGFWPPDVGDKLKLEKVLLVGGSDFTLVGTPILSRDLVSVTATVIEKKLGATKINFKKVKRKQYENTRFTRREQTMIRINHVDAIGLVGEEKDIIGVSRTV